jgi:DNA-binding YbaB/EbfC family protein
VSELTPEEPDPQLGGLDLGRLLEQAQQMQQQLMEAQASAAEQELEGHAGGGVVKVMVTGAMEFRSVTIDPAAVDPDDVEMLEDLVLAAIHDAMNQVNALQQQSLGGLGGLGGLMPES